MLPVIHAKENRCYICSRNKPLKDRNYEKVKYFCYFGSTAV